jgi:hypothetical protein
MKRQLVIAAAAFIAAFQLTANAQSELVIRGEKTNPAQSLDDRATSACFEAFIAKIRPDSRLRVSVAPKSGLAQMFLPGSVVAEMDVSMVAKELHSGKLLANGLCTVTREAKVQQLKVNVREPTRLAELTDSAIRYTHASR